MLVALAVLGSGCASYASRATARPANRGETKIAVAADLVVFEHGREYTVLPAPEVSVRRGMGEAWDIGVRLGAGSVEVAATIAPVRSARSSLAIVPNAGLAVVPVTNNGTDLIRVHAGARAVWERDVTGRVALATSVGCRVVGAGPATIVSGEAGEPRLLLEPSASFGVRVRGSSRVVWPEVSIALPVEPGDGTERPAIQAGVAIEW